MDSNVTERRQRIENGCTALSRNEIKYKIRYKQGISKLARLSALNATVCSIPKGGSTYLAIAVVILDLKQSPEAILKLSRLNIHGVAGAAMTHVWGTENSSSENGIVISRDPYTRLFSAFIDKFFLLLFPERLRYLAKITGKGYYMTKAGRCGYDVSFGDFLDIYVLPAIKGGRVNAHWAPVYAMCRMCKTNYKYVIQQETLTRDIENVFDILVTNETAKETLKNWTSSSNKRNEMAGVIKTMLSTLKKLKSFCDNPLAYAIKVWEGFKIQGYIRENRPFPWDTFKNNSALKSWEFEVVVVTTMTEDPLSNEERKAQRRRALVNAYKHIPKNTLVGIQEVFKMDFLLFGYDINPPK